MNVIAGSQETEKTSIITEEQFSKALGRIRDSGMIPKIKDSSVVSRNMEGGIITRAYTTFTGFLGE